MKILIDDVKLNLLLETKKSFIGKNVAWDSFLSAFSFLISVLLASYRDFFGLPGIALKTVFVVLGVGFTFKSLADIHDSSKNNYSYSDLLSDINKLNEITHNHSIVIIKDTFNRYPNRLLVYDDTRWNCKFFLNYWSAAVMVDFMDDCKAEVLADKELKRLYAAMSKLTERQMEIIQLYYYEGMNQEEVAEELGISQRAVSYSLESALKKIRKNF